MDVFLEVSVSIVTANSQELLLRMTTYRMQSKPVLNGFKFAVVNDIFFFYQYMGALIWMQNGNQVEAN